MTTGGVILVLVLGFAVGLVLGSFANVVISRVPKGESIAHPGSHCPSCGTPVRKVDNVPVVSWVLLGGRCRSCGWRIPARYPLIELTGGVLGLVLAGVIVAVAT
ncbi:MAG TPA: prepilin peptidase [Acidimicrobiia bacterium]